MEIHFKDSFRRKSLRTCPGAGNHEVLGEMSKRVLPERQLVMASHRHSTQIKQIKTKNFCRYFIKFFCRESVNLK